MDGSGTVLFVGDAAVLADQVGTALQREHRRYAVETAGTVEEALEHLDDDVVCIVSAYRLPERDGIEFLRTVREDDPDLPFILYTADGSEAAASDAISAGVTDYLEGETDPGDDDRGALIANRIANAVEQYQSRQELEANTERLSLLFEQSPIGVIEWDENFDFRRMNEAATDILGYEEEELRGRPWERIVPESDLPDVRAVVEDLLENKGGFHSVNENVRKDGERITCEWHNRVITDDDGETVAIVSQFQDVTERVRQERALAESQARYQSMTEDVLDTSQIGTVILDASLEVVWINAAIEEYFGVDREAVVGMHYADAVAEVKDIFADGERFERLLREAYEDQVGIQEFECHVLPGEGRRERWLSHWSKPIETGLYEGGRIGHYKDVTDRKKREHQLDAMDRVLRHNLHNAMTIILGSADTIAEATDGAVADHATMIRESGRELLDITEKQRRIVELLSDPPDVMRVDVSRVVDASVDDLRTRHPRVDVDRSVPAGLTASAIPQFEDAVDELLENAAVHADERAPTVGVTVEATADSVEVRVTDEGPVIPPAERTILRGEGEGGPLYHGSGMGLWLVNWVVTYSDGTVTYEENDPSGNVITIELSRADG